jgi:hypothetical protein
MFAASCGSAMVRFGVSAATLALLQLGTQTGAGGWSPTVNPTPIAGNANVAYATYFFGGSSTNESWILGGPAVTNGSYGDGSGAVTFASSYNFDSGWDGCDGSPDVTSAIHLYYR